MENKEPRVFKTLVHKETGEYWKICHSDSTDSYFTSKVECPEIVLDGIIHVEEILFQVDLDNLDYEEVVVLKKSEYERLKGENK